MPGCLVAPDADPHLLARRFRQPERVSEVGRGKCNRVGHLALLIVEVDLAPLGPLDLLATPERAVHRLRMFGEHASVAMHHQRGNADFPRRASIGLAPAFWVVITLLSLWALMFAAVTPVRQSYLNALIESKQRATVLSFDSLLGSSGAAVIQPLLGKTADVWGYPTSYVVSAGIQALAIPFWWLAQRERMPADPMLAEREEA